MAEQLKSLLSEMEAKHRCGFRFIPDQDKPHLHLWLISRTGVMAHVWAFTGGKRENRPVSVVEQAISVLKTHLEGREADRLQNAIEHAKTRLGAKGLL